MEKKHKIWVIVIGIMAVAVLSVPCLGTAQEKTFTNGIGMEFVLIPAGSFVMGGDKNFEDASDNETPRHRVTISKPFYNPTCDLLKN